MRRLLDLLVPPRCAGCGIEGRVLCQGCLAYLDRRLAEPAGAPLGLRVSMPARVLQLEWCATYSGPVRAAIHVLKYGGERRLVEPFSDALAARWLRVGGAVDLVAWVPVHRRRRLERGFDQAEELATGLAARMGLPAAGCLERSHGTEAQHALGRDARRENLAGALRVTESWAAAIRGRRILLVDDVMTTGATLAQCARSLADAGAAVAAITVARDR